MARTKQTANRNGPQFYHPPPTPPVEKTRKLVKTREIEKRERHRALETVAQRNRNRVPERARRNPNRGEKKSQEDCPNGTFVRPHWVQGYVVPAHRVKGYCRKK